ncbi:subunit b560 of succinate dehydrogenase [Chloropicon primus]|uniref:Subunit b560 of succinate dehydrogenase n=2 Tax=Chloropicon primus TaxID=1764295 RepID=A0A5B8MFF2_9CHLO|nr:subunit b560 of succinate dehydrogenase [Chloropicon primus]UPQ97245.1 subunit b560 of succinate dehydrogenase [Chloropicon primus]|eukprot:QDZ18030.1 subunit b560 of succinate dehydrogenase [Chloropicon primus]
MLLRSAVGMVRQGRVEKAVESLALNRIGAFGMAEVQTRNIGSWIPEFWGKKSKYTEGTEFLGTPENHLELIKKRPISPDVFSIDSVGMHYKMPVAALSSITNRVTGVVMTGGMAGLAAVSLGGDVIGTIEAAKAAFPYLVPPVKLAITFPIVFHYMAGVRHLVWDHYPIGNQTKKSLLDKEEVEKSSNALFAAAIVASGLVAAL